MNDDWYELVCQALAPKYSYYNAKTRRVKVRLKRKQLNIVNSVFKSSLPYCVNLDALYKFLQHGQPTCKFYKSQPQMLTLCCSKKLKLIFFKSGRFRLMGRFMPIRTVASRCLRHSFYKWLPAAISQDMSKCTLHKQTSTVVFKLNARVINLQQFFSFLEHHNKGRAIGYCELESFPAMAIRIWSPLHVNIFHTGNVVITGVRCNLQCCHIIRTYLFKMLHAFNKRVAC